MRNNRYIPHDVQTKMKAVKFYLDGNNIKDTCDKYNISKASLMRWVKKFNNNESLMNTPHTRYTAVYNVKTRYNAVNRYKTGKYTIKDVASFYKISISSLCRWLRKYDGTMKSLED